MSTTESSLVPRSLAETKELARELAPAGLLPAALKQKPADLLAILMTGAELGLAPMQSVRGIHIIEGKPTLSADAMAGIVLASPKCASLRVVESTDEKVTVLAQRTGQPEVKFSFSMKDAERAGLAGRGNWSKYPKAMMRARATAAACRAVWPDLLMGIYTEDELEQEKELNPAPVTVAPPRPSPVEAQVVVVEPPAPRVEAPPVDPPTEFADDAREEPSAPAASPLDELLRAVESTPTGTKDFALLGSRIQQLPAEERKQAMAAYRAKAGAK